MFYHPLPILSCLFSIAEQSSPARPIVPTPDPSAPSRRSSCCGGQRKDQAVQDITEALYGAFFEGLAQDLPAENRWSGPAPGRGGGWGAGGGGSARYQGFDSDKGPGRQIVRRRALGAGQSRVLSSSTAVAVGPRPGSCPVPRPLPALC